MSPNQRQLARALIGSRARLFGVAAGLAILIVAVPILLAVLGSVVAAVVCLVVGLVLLAGVVVLLIPGRRF